MINFFDILTFVLVCGYAIMGFRVGFARSVINMAGFLLIVLLLYIFSDEISALAARLPLLPDNISAVITFILLLTAGQIIVNLFSIIVYKIVHITPLGFIDSGLGAVSGIIKGLILCSLIALIIIKMPEGSFFKKQVLLSYSGRELASFLSNTTDFITGIFKR